jgi:hypothetical protein
MTPNTYRLVIMCVGITLVLCVTGIIGLSWGAGTGRPVPDILQNIASGALTGLIGLLVTPRHDDSDPGG